MTTKKILIIVGAVVLGIGLLVVVFVGAILGVTFYSINRSEAADKARSFLQTSNQLKQDIGEIKEFGSLVTGSINVDSDGGHATINLKVVGERQVVNASVELVYQKGQPWRVSAASYQNDKGQTIELLNPYEGRLLPPKLIIKVAA